VTLASLSCTAEDQAEKAEAPRVHPHFDISQAELEAIIADQEEDIQRAVLQRPQYFLELLHRALDLPPWALVLVDKEHGLPPDYSPRDLVELNEYRLSLNRESLQLSRACMPAVLAMTEAARSDGVELVYSSTYRSYDYQQGLYESYVQRYGRQEADRFSARPGTSQHQLGTSIDFGSITPEFGDTEAGRWLLENAWKYGFSLSYPEGYEELTGYMFEIWHYRYITTVGTRLEREFFQGIQQHLTEFWHRHRDFFAERSVNEEQNDEETPNRVGI